MVLRVAGLALVLLAMQGLALGRRHAELRSVVYVVDQSASIDEGKRRWEMNRLASLESLRPSMVSRSLMVFGRQASPVSVERGQLTDPAALERLVRPSGVDPRATDLEAALLAGLAEDPADHAPAGGASKNVVLVTDGRETAGRVERALGYLRRFGLRVYPVAVPPRGSGGLAWERLWVSPTAKQGSAVPVKLLLSNGSGAPGQAEVVIRMQGLPVASARYRLPGAWHVVTISAPAAKPGTMALDIAVRLGDDQQPQHRTAYVEVEGPPQVLFVTERSDELPVLGRALKEREIGVAVARPGELPAEAGRLLDYDAVVLEGIPKSSITEAQAAALKTYVERFGGGVVSVGLGGKLDQEIAHDAPLDSLLPLRFEPKGLQEAKRRVCVVLLIDRSASMLGPRIAATKRAAVELVKQLQPEDLVGVLAFDTAPYVVVEVEPAAQASASLIEKLVRLRSTGGTDLLPALRAAQARLLMTDAKVKHIILLSDGNTPFETTVYGKLFGDLIQQQISISTIGIGSAFINTQILDLLARATTGTYYQLNSLDDLPRLIARDTQQTLGQLPFSEGYFRPVRAEEAAWFEDVSQWPPLKGYLTTSAKPGARVEVEIQRAGEPAGETTAAGEHPPELARDPLLARWSLGLGHVASFASDADARWSPEWIRWPDYERVWAQLFREVMRPRAQEELFVWFDERQGRQALVLEGQLTSPDAQLIAEDGRSAAPLALLQESQVRWSAPVGQLAPGWYRLAVSSRQESSRPLSPPTGGPGNSASGRESSPVLMTRWIQIGRIEGAREDPTLPPDQALLGHISQATQGLDDAPDAAVLPEQEWSTQRLPLRPWLLPLVLVLLLADVALRGRTLL
ncbi:MAG: VWA domain-containing protein [Candidatus Omnitrophica bacterium]|nr:VWA domain-containing protein [Candidatus Omnitrophota bacterium]